MRYAVFKDIEDVSHKPVFTAPWKWLAHLIANHISFRWNTCLILDTKHHEVVLHWQAVNTLRHSARKPEK